MRRSPPTTSIMPSAPDTSCRTCWSASEHKLPLDDNPHLRPNSEYYLKSPTTDGAALRRASRRAGGDAADRRALPLRAARRLAGAAARFRRRTDRALSSTCANSADAGARWRFGAVSEHVRQQLDHELERHRARGLGELLPDRLGHRAFRPRAGHPLPGARQRRQFAGRLRARHLAGRSDCPRSGLRALSLRRAPERARHRHGLSSRRSAARKSSSTFISARGTTTRRWRVPSVTFRARVCDPRRGQSAGAAARPDRPRGESRRPLRRARTAASPALQDVLGDAATAPRLAHLLEALRADQRLAAASRHPQRRRSS